MKDVDGSVLKREVLGTSSLNQKVPLSYGKSIE
jgi:hypothetical protein